VTITFAPASRKPRLTALPSPPVPPATNPSIVPETVPPPLPPGGGSVSINYVDADLYSLLEYFARATGKNFVIQDVRVLAVDQLADQRADKPSVVKAVTIEVDPTEGQKVALAATVGTLSLLLRKAGDAASADTRRVTTRDLMTAPAQESHFVTIAVTRPSKGERVEYTVPVEGGDAHSAALVNREPARN